METTRIRSNPLPSLLVIALFCGPLATGCKVVVEDYAAANVFSYSTSGVYDQEEGYIVGLMTCTTELQPVKVTEEPGTAGAFFNTVSGQFTNAAGWTYSSAANKLSSGSIRVRTYDAQGTSTRVGAEIHVVYQPGSSDPSTGIHWVQVISTNHSLKAPAGHGNSATYVDIPSSATTPYYDDGYAANQTDFYDFPGRIDAAKDHTWEATTFLATGPAVGAGAGAVTFQRPGFKWGWINNCEPIFDFPGWLYYLERELTFVIQDTLLPGLPFTLLADTTDGLMVMRGEEKASTSLTGVVIEGRLGEQIDQGGYYPIEVSRGEFMLGAYAIGNEEVGSSRGTIGSGSGYLHWETGEASIRFEATIDSGETQTEVVFVGTAAVSSEKGLFVLQIDTKGVEKLEGRE